MKRNRFIVLLSLLFLSVTAGGQNSNSEEVKSGSFSYKVKPGKSANLMDECNVDFSYKKVVGDPVYTANLQWSRLNEFTVTKGAKKTKITYAQLAEYPDLQKRFDMIVPVNAIFDFTVLFYSSQSDAYIASAKTRMEFPFVGKAGVKDGLFIPVTKKWSEMFTNVVVGKQSKDKVGTIIPDAALEESFKTEKLLTGKLDFSVRGSLRTLSRVYSRADRIDVVSVSGDLYWNEDDFEYIIDEYNRRKSADKLLAAGDTAKSLSTYFDNRTFLPVVSVKDFSFWNTTTLPIENLMDYVDKADKFYASSKWDEARVFYKKAADADPKFSYPANKLKKIQKYKEYKATRNVGGIDLVYVEGTGSIKSFYIGKTEITQRQWRRVMGSNPSSFKGCFDCPVENVSFEEAIAFVRKLKEQTGLNYRLPKMEEWEYAAKGGVNKMSAQYSGSDNLDEISWCAYNSDENTHQVASKSPNSLGIYDMTGNVCEWVSDSYDNNTRYVKGGSWADDAVNSTIQAKEKYNVKVKNNRVGFRVCQDE